MSGDLLATLPAGLTRWKLAHTKERKADVGLEVAASLPMLRLVAPCFDCCWVIRLRRGEEMCCTCQCNLPWHGTGIRETFAFSLEIGALALSTFDAESWFGQRNTQKCSS